MAVKQPVLLCISVSLANTNHSLNHEIIQGVMKSDFIEIVHGYSYFYFLRLFA